MKRPSKHLLMILASLVLHGVSSVLLWNHAEIISALQGSTLPVALEMPVLERKQKLLKEQVSLSEAEASLQYASSREYISAFVLPEKLDLDRLLGFFDLLRDDFSKQKLLTEMSAIEVGDAEAQGTNPDLNLRPVTFAVKLSEEGLGAFLSLLPLTGIFTVADAFSQEQIATLLDYTSREHPTAIVSLEQFLETPLAEYAHESRHYEDRLLRSATSEEFLSTFESIRDTSSLPAVVKLFQRDLGKVLLERKLWPTPLLVLDTVEIQSSGEGAVNVSLELNAFERSLSN